MNSIAVVYCFDNTNQIEMFKHSIMTIEEQENIDFVVVVKEGLEKNDDLIKIKEIIGERFKLHTIEKVNFTGMFYWLITPLLTQYDYYVQLDNDTLVNNVDLNELIFKYKNKLKRKSFLGIKSLAWRSKKNKRVIKLYRKNAFDFYLKSHKYINTGVVLINGKRVRDILIKKGFGKEQISEFIENVNKNKFRKSDQEFLHSFWWKEISFISLKYNLRLHVLYDLIRNKREKEYIAHYNLHSLLDKKWIKFDFLNNIKTMEKEEFLDEISSFWALSEERKHWRKNKFRKVISFLYDDISKMVKNEKSNF